ncbi:uncharacterized protein LOC124419936 [Lucilia cuprina]|uniref:uncharacterized protein LOC124419936 n=1 Tax=Lucilia cuprina TaxID=7375 RepID=UPI001F055F42|nr:uncharacterized protein LOC124419936 [Lucilia cuprina]
MTMTDLKNRPLQRLPYRPMSAEPILHRSHFHHPTPQKLPSTSTSSSTACNSSQQQQQQQQQLLQQQAPPLPTNSYLHPSSQTNIGHYHRYTSHHASLRHLGGFGSRLAGNSSSTSKIMGPTYYHSSTTHNTPQKQFMYKTSNTNTNDDSSCMGLIDQTHFDNQHQEYGCDDHRSRRMSETHVLPHADYEQDVVSKGFSNSFFVNILG